MKPPCAVTVFDHAARAWWSCECGARSRTGWSTDRQAANAARAHVLRGRKKRRES